MALCHKLEGPAFSRFLRAASRCWGCSSLLSKLPRVTRWLAAPWAEPLRTSGPGCTQSKWPKNDEMWASQEKKSVRPPKVGNRCGSAKSPECCPCSTKGGGVDSCGVGLVVAPGCGFAVIPPTAPGLSEATPAVEAALPSLCSLLQCCRNLSSLLTRPHISGTWTHARRALCGPGEKGGQQGRAPPLVDTPPPGTLPPPPAGLFSLRRAPLGGVAPFSRPCSPPPGAHPSLSPSSVPHLPCRQYPQQMG